MSMKIELEGREVVRHTNAVHLLVSMGYQFDGFAWKAPEKEEEQKGFHIEVETSSITFADTQLSADIEALTQRVSDLEFAANPGYYDFSKLTQGQRDRTNAFNQAVEQQFEICVERSSRPGGVLYRAIRK